MKKKYIVGIAIACVAILAFAMLTEAYGDGKDIKGKIGKFFKHRWQQRAKMQNIWRNMLNFTKIEGTLEYINGSYYINGIELYVGNENFLNRMARSDYDRDGIYEYVWQELEGLIGKEVVINGVLRNDILYVSHINGIWYRVPREMPEIVEISGILEYINGSYYINDTELIIKRGFSKSDIDRDGSLERMNEEMNGLLGEEIRVDGFFKDGRLVVIHVNGIWAR